MADVEIAEMPGLAEATAQLDAMMAADGIQSSAPAAPSAPSTEDPGSVIPEADHAPQADKGTPADPDPKQTDTPAAADKKSDGKAPEEKESRYAKAATRQEKSWAELNRQKEEFKAQQDALKAEREQIAREKAEWQKQREQAEVKYTPEQYEQFAEECENQGKFDMADAARARAKQLRENPPAKAQPKADPAQLQRLQKEYWAKAAIDFPEVAREGTVQNAKLKELLASEPSVLDDPKGMYYAARLAQAESAAASVPSLQKELGELRAKVKELETASAPSGPGSPAGVPAAGPQGDTLADLERAAMELGTLR